MTTVREDHTNVTDHFLFKWDVNCCNQIIESVSRIVQFVNESFRWTEWWIHWKVQTEFPFIVIEKQTNNQDILKYSPFEFHRSKNVKWVSKDTMLSKWQDFYSRWTIAIKFSYSHPKQKYFNDCSSSSDESENNNVVIVSIKTITDVHRSKHI